MSFSNRAFIASLLTVMGLLLACPMNSSLAEGVPGKFDYHVLALSWQPAFCETRPDKTECVSQDENRFDAKNFVLHGLWPSVSGDSRHRYGYCDVPDNLIHQDKTGNWCDLPMLKLSEPVRDDLSTVMPGSVSCLQQHEWYKHGVCSGLSPDEYYALSGKLVRMFSKTKFNRFVSDNIGKYVKRKDVLNAFEREFGKGSRSYLELQCKTVNRTKCLTEIRIYLGKNLSESDHLEDMFPKFRIRIRGGCPETFKIDKAGLGNL